MVFLIKGYGRSRIEGEILIKGYDQSCIEDEILIKGYADLVPTRRDLIEKSHKTMFLVAITSYQIPTRSSNFKKALEPHL